jgi:large subunit ribosomal protein L3
MPPRPSSSIVAIALPPPFLLPRSLLQSRLQICQKRSLGIRSHDKKVRHDKYHPKTLHASREAALRRKEVADTIPYRTGLMAVKKGMTALYDGDQGDRVACTVLQLDRNQVVHHRTYDQHGYFAVCIGAGHKSESRVSKPQLGHFSVQGVPPKRWLHEFRVRDKTGLVPVGRSLSADHFLVGQFVDTRSVSKGKGFAGAMKRWGFHGQDRSHGVSLTHRSLGSTGGGQGSGSRVYPGKKMPGRMGGKRNTIQSLRVMQTDAGNGIVVVKGMLN